MHKIGRKEGPGARDQVWTGKLKWLVQLNRIQPGGRVRHLPQHHHAGEQQRLCHYWHAQAVQKLWQPWTPGWPAKAPAKSQNLNAKKARPSPTPPSPTPIPSGPCPSQPLGPALRPHRKHCHNTKFRDLNLFDQFFGGPGPYR
ncbi:hypothetical protein DPEC_G00259670 [Dallia pectoralis]|uniref:Uncharacterized protein n=1 Tax=Dallia pectoralis TaxID=75939 RepID=A0ACC2FRH0_DALPE|nr:hypothetical protein DPEC_G00259670 [Dallia pectoralis]